MKMGYSELLYKKHLLDEEYIILGGIFEWEEDGLTKSELHLLSDYKEVIEKYTGKKYLITTDIIIKAMLTKFDDFKNNKYMNIDDYKKQFITEVFFIEEANVIDLKVSSISDGINTILKRLMIYNKSKIPNNSN